MRASRDPEFASEFIDKKKPVRKAPLFFQTTYSASSGFDPVASRGAHGPRVSEPCRRTGGSSGLRPRTQPL